MKSRGQSVPKSRQGNDLITDELGDAAKVLALHFFVITLESRVE